MLRRFLVLSFCAAVGVIIVYDSGGASQQPDSRYSKNQCVNCHAKSSLPNLSSRYMDWHFSAHKTYGVGCDRCHGGDATARDPQRAHKGVIPSSSKQSRLSLERLPETCGTCHKAVVNSFVESVHYQKLNLS